MKTDANVCDILIVTYAISEDVIMRAPDSVIPWYAVWLKTEAAEADFFEANVSHPYSV